MPTAAEAVAEAVVRTVEASAGISEIVEGEQTLSLRSRLYYNSQKSITVFAQSYKRRSRSLRWSSV